MNPEFLRNIWLELSPQRLLLMPILLALFFGVVHLQTGELAHTAIAGAALPSFLAITCLWGARKAREAFIEEGRQGTWDTQRMSALSPWDMAWGKLFGATIYVWYAGGLCLATFLATVNGLDWPFEGLEISHWTVTRLVIASIGLAVLVQALAAANGLITLRFGERGFALNGVMTLMFWVGVASPAWMIVSQGFADEAGVLWWGSRYQGLDFLSANVVVFACWGVLALWRLISAELRVPGLPLAWPLFLAFFVIWLLGFIPDAGLYDQLGLACLIVSLGAYIAAFIERRDPILIQRLQVLGTSADMGGLLRQVPASFQALAIALALALLLVLARLTGVMLPLNLEPSFEIVNAAFAFAPIAALLALRDLALLQFYVLGSRPDRSTTNLLVALFVLDWLLPTLLSPFSEETGGGGLMTVVFPYADAANPLAVLMAAVHAGAALGLLRLRWKARFAGLS